MLMTNNFKGGTRNFFATVTEIPNHQEFDDSELLDDPDIEKITTQHSLYLRVRSISPAIYRYYRGMSSQLTDNMFTEHPTVVVGNIENGYGSFAVYNTAIIPLLEWETFEYHKKRGMNILRFHSQFFRITKKIFFHHLYC